MTLWNWIVPTLVVGAHAIDYPHAIGLLVLCRILFGGFRGDGGCRKHRQWRHWQRMTPILLELSLMSRIVDTTRPTASLPLSAASEDATYDHAAVME